MTREEQLSAVRGLIASRFARFRDLQSMITTETAPREVAKIGHTLTDIERETAGMTQAAIAMGFTLHEVMN